MQVKTKNLVVGALAVLLVGALWYRVVYSPMESKASKAKAAAHEADTTAENLRQALGESAKPKNKAADVSSQAMLAAVPADSAEASFLRGLDAVRIVSGADWQSVTPIAPTTSGTVSSMTVAITVQGTEDQLARYLNGLNGMKRLFVVDNVSINGTGPAAAGGTGQGSPGAVFFGDKFQAAISGRIFSQPSAVATATAGATTAGAATTPVTGAPAPTG